jgi:uncharacterized delta-60 repeat protein
MKKLYMLLMAAFFMLIMGCGGDSGGIPPSSVKAITTFSLNGVFGTINETGKTIAVTMPFGTDVTSMVATFTTTGTSVKVGSTVQISGTTTNDFTSPVVYTVTAANATTQDYTVTVTVNPSLSGSLDTGFGTGGNVITPIGSSNDYALALGIQSDGRIVAAGYSYNGSNFDFALVRYNTNGTLDTTFGSGGIVTTPVGIGHDAANALVIQSDGRIVAAGYSYNGSNYDFALVRYNTDGSLDATFGTGGIVTTPIGSAEDIAYALGIQSDGRIMAAGSSFNSGSNKHDIALVRYNTDGSLDATFGAGGKVTTTIGSINDYAYALGIQSDGRIVAAGSSYNSGSNNYDFALVRYNANGTLDTGFGTGGIVTTPVRSGNGNDYAHALSIQSDGRIVAAGSSDNGSKYDFALVRYNANGTLDTGFGTGGIVITPIGSGFDIAYALGIQPDGRIVAAGSSDNGSNFDFALVRYNANGTLDTGFSIGGIVTTPIGSSDDYAIALGIQSSDGKIVAAGYSYNGSNFDFALVRYWP